MTRQAVKQLFGDLAEAARLAPAAKGVSPQHLERARQGATAFQQALGSADLLDWEPSTVPSSANYTNATTDFGQRLVELAPTLPWKPARQDPTGTDRALLSINDMFDLGPLIAGFVLVRPRSFYPLHQHPPQELYLTIDGTAEWRFGGAEATQAVPAGHVFYNPPNVVHEQRNGAATNVAMYVLWPET